ncbi:protease [Thermothelomyces thermophilus ATCC 42464]|uniref:Protease n=1 Tax=Thermothelomyces thermophilus (strain ATCC 42464 / BCRC 31852 / DSM 1799) TaxID=573729 RepID=G2QCB5_THET4|nr:protease [Thermothelomyces thermophilus ATCC 42464]AEO57290.1 protease [Thermothelomyces thermophilus ATCC 42464]
MCWLWERSVAILLAAGVIANPLRPRRIPWPEPVPASSIGPIDWSSIPPSPYKHALRQTNTTTTSSSSSSSSSKYDNQVYSVQVSGSSSSPPASVDWRNRDGQNYITTPQDQGACNSCWAFAVAALIESMMRIEHGVWGKRSEADVHDGVGAACESVGNAEDTLAWVAGQGPEFVADPTRPAPGIADWACDPYEATAHAYEHCDDRSGRTTHIPYYQALGLVEDQKRWLDEYGPIIATFVLYDDFGSWKPTAAGGSGGDVYRWDGVSGSDGNHLAIVIGYDDEKQAWLMKNSWGSGWGDEGFVYFAYGEANIDNWTKYGLVNVNPDPWTRRKHQSGSMMQSGNGETHRNFELLVSEAGGSGFTHVSRDGNSTQWSKVLEVSGSGSGSGLVGQPAILGTSFNRDFHAVSLDENQVVQQWAYRQSEMRWSRVSAIEGTKIDGFPGLAQSDGSTLVMVVKHADGTLNEWQQAPNSTTWTLANSPIASGIAQSGPALVQSNAGLNLYDRQQGASRGNIYTVAVREDGKLQLFWRPGADAAGWSAGEVFGGSGVVDPGSPPVMIQDYSGTANETSVGRFQLAVAVGGSVQHWERANDDLEAGQAPPAGAEGGSPAGRWELVETAGTGVKRVWALLQGSFGGRLHMITEGTDGRLSYWERDEKWVEVEKLPALSDAAWTRSGPVSGG